MNCHICKNNQLKKIFLKDHYSLYRCLQCGHVYVDPMPTKEELEEFYSSDYFQFGSTKGYREGYENFGELQKKFLQKILNNIVRINPKAKSLLDIGCAYGFFLKLASEIGLKVEGVEVSKTASVYAMKNYSLVIHNGTLQSYIKQNSYPKFDVVTMLDVLEHLQDPDEAIQIASQLIESGGVLVIKVPNVGSTRARIQGKRWRQIKPPEHLHYFSKRSIESLLAKHSFQIIKLSKVGGVGINLMNNVPKKAFDNIIYKAIKVPIIKLAKIIGWLDQIEVYARKV